jgi:WxcM-like, C-terminal
MNGHWLSFELKTEKGGVLVPLETGREIPFAIRRVFFLREVGAKSRRGQHAHKNFQEVLICLEGHCRVRLDDGHTVEEYCLDRPDRGLLIGARIWEEAFDFSPDCILLGLADNAYAENDLYLDYTEFLKIQRAKP